MAHSADVDNLAQLVELTTDSLEGTLKARFEQKKIYTYVGDILIAQNPYEWLTHLYTDEVAAKYKGNITQDSAPPHVFAVANRAYEALLLSKTAQCFVVSGESGAGKSETTKLLVHHLMDLCKSDNKELEQQIIAVQPMLEAFGNAKTVMNNNSSRFGKYLELTFQDSGAVTGGRMLHYLLEKSRVVTRNANEQNFHIFYQMYAGMSANDKLNDYCFDKPSKHLYLQGQGAPSDADVLSSSFNTEWTEVIDAMKEIKFKPEQMSSMYNLLAAILHIGDVAFSDGGNDDVNIKSAQPVENVAKLLSVDAAKLSETFKFTSSITRGEVIQKNFNMESAVSNRDSVAKAIYGKMFAWIFRTCNAVLDSGTDGQITLGLLDIFGFENFANNSIEQMCINITNEQLQNYFNQHIFVLEQEIYAKEGIDFSTIDFIDNQTTLDLFLKKGGVFSTLDEESRFPKATDLTFVEKCTNALKGHPSTAFEPPKSSRDALFTITHYAGKVKYTCPGFLEKNRDQLSPDVETLLGEGGDDLLKHLFTFHDAAAEVVSKNKTSKHKATLCSGFKASLLDLSQRLGACEPHFIRCLKPNAQKKPVVWETDLVTRQLLYSGVLETVKIRKKGYSYRLPFGDFVARHKIISFDYGETPEPNQENCKKILDEAGIKDYRMGTTKVFLKYFHSEELQKVTAIQTQALVFMQKVVKAYVVRMDYETLKAQKKMQEETLGPFFATVEDFGAKSLARTEAKNDEDHREEGNRSWLKQVQKQQAAAEAQKITEEQDRKDKLEAMENEPAKIRTRVANGYFVWKRNDHLELEVGELPAEWRMKIDAETGREYFQNSVLKQTSWVDPRGLDQYSHDPSQTEGADLPFGWDEAETEDGVKFFIDHSTGLHHKVHPREDLQKKEAQIKDRNSLAEAKVAELIAKLKQFREKKNNLDNMIAHTTDDEAAKSLESRTHETDGVIKKTLSEIEAENSQMRTLKDAVEQYRARKTMADCMAA